MATFHYSSEIHGKNQWNPTRKDNFIIHNSYKNRNKDSSGFKATHASQYYTEKLRRKYIKLSLAADALQQIICTMVTFPGLL
jgi:hypothetical protein